MADELLKLLNEFRDFQMANNVPYQYDILGLAEWLEFDKLAAPKEQEDK